MDTKGVSKELSKIASLLTAATHFPNSVKYNGNEYYSTGKEGMWISTGLDSMEYKTADWIWVTSDGSIYHDDSRSTKPVGKVPKGQIRTAAGSASAESREIFKLLGECHKLFSSLESKNRKDPEMSQRAMGELNNALSRATNAVLEVQKSEEAHRGIFQVQHGGKNVKVSVPPK